MTDKNEAWASAMAESETPETRDAGLWAKCFAENDGNEARARAAYINAKVDAEPAREHLPWTPLPPVSMSAPVEATRRRVWPWIVGTPIVLIVLFLGFGAIQMQQPGAQERMRASDVIGQCWSDQKRKSLDGPSQRFFAAACERLEDDYRAKYGRNP